MTEMAVSPLTHPEAFTVEERVVAAAREWVARKSGVSSPVGTYTPKGYWYPDDLVERRRCCRTHVPRQQFPQAVKKHCLGLGHIAHLFDVPADAVKVAAKHL